MRGIIIGTGISITLWALIAWALWLCIPALTHYQAAQEMGECCGNCRKRWETTCSEYKENRRRPNDGDWCAGWRGRKP
jgi:hypothetical protein